MKKALLFSGSHPRHLFVHRELLNIFDEYFIIVMERENLLPETPKNTSELDKKNFIKHFKNRARIEKDCYGILDPYEVFKNFRFIYIKPNELNSEKVIKQVKEYNADFAFIFGTDLIKPPLLNILPKNKINLHLGLTPWFRGAATLFWPFYFLRPQYAGITFHQIVEKADAGEVLHQSAPKLLKNDSIHEVGARCVKDAAVEVKKLTYKLLDTGFLKGQKQTHSGKLWLNSDFHPSHLRLIYDLYNDKIVDLYLDGKLSRKLPKIYNGLIQ